MIYFYDISSAEIDKITKLCAKIGMQFTHDATKNKIHICASSHKI